MITALYRRNLLPGSEYNDLIPSSVCHSTFRGDGDTHHSMNLIQEFIEDYSDQVSKIAPLLQGKTVEQTVTNIYNFLYNHIQYKADGAAQQIRSPQCAWHSRANGTDCKSYSVFAGALCKELGLPFSIRKIQQSGDANGTYSHVYIIVHRKNKPHLVIDATKHENTESFYIKKHDINMKHYGLNASNIASNQNNCAFHDYFGRICNTLSNNGVCNTQINKLKNNVNDHVKKTGHYPYITVEVDTIYINEKPQSFRNANGTSVLIATKHGLNSVTAVGGTIAVGALKDSLKGAIPKIKDKVKRIISDLWKKIKCKLSKGAWRDGDVTLYIELSEKYFFGILDKFDNSPDEYFIPDNTGKSQFTKDFDYHILEFWSEVAKYQFELDTYANRTCSRDRLRGVIQTSQEVFKGIQELYSEVSVVYPFDSYLTVRSPIMNFTLNRDRFWDFNRTLEEARSKGHNDPIPQIQLPQIIVNVDKLNEMYSPRPDYDFVEGGTAIINPPGGGSSSGNTGGGVSINPPKTGGGQSFTQSPIATGKGTINQTGKQQKAGFGALPALLIATAGYAAYRQSQSKKTKKK